MMEWVNRNVLPRYNLTADACYCHEWSVIVYALLSSPLQVGYILNSWRILDMNFYLLFLFIFSIYICIYIVIYIWNVYNNLYFLFDLYLLVQFPLLSTIRRSLCVLFDFSTFLVLVYVCFTFSKHLIVQYCEFIR